jgi:heme-degrading monooxygenase HmoA
LSVWARSCTLSVSEEGNVSETYTCSLWTVPAGRQDDFVPAFQAFAAAADELGAGEGFILQDQEDASRFIVVRRWESVEAIERWQQAERRRREAGKALAQLVPEAQQAHVCTKVAYL